MNDVPNEFPELKNDEKKNEKFSYDWSKATGTKKGQK